MFYILSSINEYNKPTHAHIPQECQTMNLVGVCTCTYIIHIILIPQSKKTVGIQEEKTLATHSS